MVRNGMGVGCRTTDHLLNLFVEVLFPWGRQCEAASLLPLLNREDGLNLHDGSDGRRQLRNESHVVGPELSARSAGAVDFWKRRV
jgi:hypothetical protein